MAQTANDKFGMFQARVSNALQTTIAAYVMNG